MKAHSAHIRCRRGRFSPPFHHINKWMANFSSSTRFWGHFSDSWRFGLQMEVCSGSDKDIQETVTRRGKKRAEDTRRGFCSLRGGWSLLQTDRLTDCGTRGASEGRKQENGSNLTRLQLKMRMRRRATGNKCRKLAAGWNNASVTSAGNGKTSVVVLFISVGAADEYILYITFFFLPLCNHSVHFSRRVFVLWIRLQLLHSAEKVHSLQNWMNRSDKQHLMAANLGSVIRERIEFDAHDHMAKRKRENCVTLMSAHEFRDWAIKKSSRLFPPLLK